MKYLLISFALMLLCFAGFLITEITEEPTRAALWSKDQLGLMGVVASSSTWTLWEWAANILTIATTANLIVALAVFVVVTAWRRYGQTKKSS
ncbi:MAG: hypothetical protein Q7T57_06440 [Dehalococcoidales bacterium]|nr:hypothetical protein [Dehalococcoidales bacterium]